MAAQVDPTDGPQPDTGPPATWVLSNHDNPSPVPLRRLQDRRAALFLLLGLQGSPCSTGEEMSLGTMVTGDKVVGPSGRDGCRAPIPWAGRQPGWSVADSWLPWRPADTRNVEALRARGSITT